jgi:hypothetical protein
MELFKLGPIELIINLIIDLDLNPNFKNENGVTVLSLLSQAN